MKASRGFSTLEILIAMAVLFLTLGAVILVSFGNQSAVIDSQTDAEALTYGERLLEAEIADARKDFNLVNSYATTSTDGFYFAQVTSELQSDYLTKKVSVRVSWQGDHLRPQSVSLVNLITNFTNAVGANTCNSTPDGDWKNPTLAATYDLGTVSGDASGVYPITDIDAYQGKLYVTSSNSSGPVTQPNFFVFSIVNPNSTSPSLSYVSKMDTDTSVASGVAAVAVATNSAGSYAYLANASGLTKGQLQVVNLGTNAVTSYKLPSVTQAGVGNSIYYRDGYVYLGLTAAGGHGNELNVLDVHTPTSPYVRSSVSIGNDVNSLFVKGLYAYSASPNSQQLKVFDISNPNNITSAGGYTGSGGNGKSLYAVGDSAYLGTAQGNGSLYELFDISTPGTPSLKATKSFTASVDGIIVRDALAFILTKSALQIINATSTAAWSSAYPLPASGSALYEPVMDCEGNTIFVASNDSSNHGKIYVFTPKP